MFKKLIKGLYYQWYINDDIADLSHECMSLREKYTEASLQYREQLLDNAILKKQLAHFDGHKAMPLAVTSDVLAAMLQYISDKEKTKQPIDCLVLYDRIINSYKRKDDAKTT